MVLIPSKKRIIFWKNAVLCLLCKFWAILIRNNDGTLVVRKLLSDWKKLSYSAGRSWGVLEPAQALPTIIEDNVFLGAMPEVVEG
ncbi:MAG: hypothetical protein CM1200mP13_13810 [Candidatus Pelagibacterales bacterium]|nr:MAG: hypothetical protein CM1200mP13_13810 [Pelagibacterales bacterium]